MSKKEALNMCVRPPPAREYVCVCVCVCVCARAHTCVCGLSMIQKSGPKFTTWPPPPKKKGKSALAHEYQARWKWTRVFNVRLTSVVWLEKTSHHTDESCLFPYLFEEKNVARWSLLARLKTHKRQNTRSGKNSGEREREKNRKRMNKKGEGAKRLNRKRRKAVFLPFSPSMTTSSESVNSPLWTVSWKSPADGEREREREREKERETGQGRTHQILWALYFSSVGKLAVGRRTGGEDV